MNWLGSFALEKRGELIRAYRIERQKDEQIGSFSFVKESITSGVAG